jgi:hypothetical protein
MSRAEQPYSSDHRSRIEKQNWEYLRSFPDIHLSLIGEQLGSGFYHMVFAYEDGWVLKIPKLLPGFPLYTAEERRDELDLMKEFFPSESIVETRIISSPHKPFYCFIQKKINNHGYADKGDVDNAQLQAIIEANRRVIEHEHATFDFFGFAGFMWGMQSLLDKCNQHFLTNILTQTDEQGVKHFHVADTTLYFFDKKYRPQESLKHTVAQIALLGNKYLMKNFFGTDILPKILG